MDVSGVKNRIAALLVKQRSMRYELTRVDREIESLVRVIERTDGSLIPRGELEAYFVSDDSGV